MINPGMVQECLNSTNISNKMYSLIRWNRMRFLLELNLFQRRSWFEMAMPPELQETFKQRLLDRKDTVMRASYLTVPGEHDHRNQQTILWFWKFRNSTMHGSISPNSGTQVLASFKKLNRERRRCFPPGEKERERGEKLSNQEVQELIGAIKKGLFRQKKKIKNGLFRQRWQPP